MKKTSMEDIAKALNISKVSVSKALNDKEGVSESLRKLVKETAIKMNYRLNNSARSLKTSKHQNVGILIAEKYSLDKVSYYLSVSAEIVCKLDEKGYSGIVEMITYAAEENCLYPRFYSENKVDGIIILGQMSHRYLRFIEKVSVPVIFFDFYMKDFEVDSIVTDNFFSAYLLTNFLIKQQHKKIAYVGTIEATSSILDRFLGYYKSLIENHIPLKNDYVIPDRDSKDKYIDLELPKKLPEAFVCNCDWVAYSLITTLKKKGIKVPEEVSVVGFDNSIFSTISDPQITTIDNNVSAMVETGVKMIIKKIHNPNHVYGRILIQGSLVVRESSIERG